MAWAGCGEVFQQKEERVKRWVAVSLWCVGWMGCAGEQRVPQEELVEAVVQAEEAKEASWDQTLERVIPCVVSLKVNVPKPFDMVQAGNSQGTGFVVDAARGIILTNRHLTLPNPGRTTAVFQNQEEVELTEVYYDVVHDFGFYQFDPAALEFMKVCELKLAPERAQVGIEVRVVGNNSGEKISILDSNLARLDRQAPDYGSKRYNDFNTFYYQAATGTSGGSSGSPVLDRQGHVVALNAGSTSAAASSYYLPLHSVVRALRKIQQDEPISRGTLEATFVHTPFNDLRKMGLDPQVERRFRQLAPGNTGLLRVEDVVSSGASGQVLRPGDVLLEVGQQPVVGFDGLEQQLDALVGQEVKLLVDRQGEVLGLVAKVADLQALGPRAYVEFGDTVIHEISYQLARHYGQTPLEGLVLANASGLLEREGLRAYDIITAIDQRPVRTLDELWEALVQVNDGSRMRVTYTRPWSKGERWIKIVEMDRRWATLKRCAQSQGLRGTWTCLPPPALAAGAKEKHTALGLKRALPPKGADSLTRSLSPSMVRVRSVIPFAMAAQHEGTEQGVGVVLDAQRGLILTSREVVKIELAEVEVVFGDVVTIPANVELVHPFHNLVLLSYDPKHLGALRAKSVKLAARPAKQGDTVSAVVMGASGTFYHRQTTVTRRSPIRLSSAGPPAYRQANLEVLSVQDVDSSMGGVLATRRGEVAAFWFFFDDQKRDKAAGIPVEVVKQMLGQWERDKNFVHRILGVKLTTMNMDQARRFGLDQRWTQELLNTSRSDKAIVVWGKMQSFPSSKNLQNHDILLAIDGQTVGSMFDIERLVQKPTVRVKIWRAGGEVEFDHETVALEHQSDTLIFWSGLHLHDPHLSLKLREDVDFPGVYVAFRHYGSPNSGHGVTPGSFITELGGIPTPDVATFLKVAKTLRDGEDVLVTTRMLSGRVHRSALRLDLTYFPLRILKKSQGEWGWVEP